jgi:predicted acylesterase/phospholipase RssA
VGTERSSATPLPIQVVFQGGGAKLCHLMAVCDVLKGFEATDRIRVTRAAGSSAGAIAAVMLASAQPISEYKVRVTQTAAQFGSSLRVSELTGKWRVFNGHPYFGKTFYLEDVFTHLFGKAIAQTEVSKFRFPLELYFTDLYSLGSRTAPQDDTCARALAKSCRYPFAFVGYKSDEVEVDGGLALNLPVDGLHARASQDGSVIAISFENTPGRHQKGLRAYAEQLMSASIQSSVTRSQIILGHENVFAIKTDIGTFEFERALADGLGSHFELTAERFRGWFGEWLRTKMAEPLPRPAVIRPTLANFKLPPAVIKELHINPTVAKTRGKKAQSFETANFDQNGKFDGTYSARSVLTFTVLQPTSLSALQFQIAKDASFDSAGLKCWATNAVGMPLKFSTHVEEISQERDPMRTFLLYFLFEETLTPSSESQPYTLGHEARIGDPYPALGQSPEIAAFFRGEGDAEEMLLAVAFPRDLLRTHSIVTDICDVPADKLQLCKGLSLQPGEKLIKSEEQPFDLIVDSLRLATSFDRYYVVGRLARNVGPRQGFGVLIE